jgi:hypothetical protein
MTITIQISNKKNRYGYIAKNDRVHDVVPQNLLNNSYGAGFEGDKGLANHGDLALIYSDSPFKSTADELTLASAFTQRTGYNPDFGTDLDTAGFDYAQPATTNNRAKDGVDSSSKSPNILFPHLSPGNTDRIFTDPEGIMTPAPGGAFDPNDIDHGLDGGGGFGPEAVTQLTDDQSRPDHVTQSILDRY